MFYKELFDLLKYEFFNSSSKNIDADMKTVCTNFYSYITNSFMFNRWISGLFINKEKFVDDLYNDENILFMERLFCGITYVKNPKNIEVIKRLQENIKSNRKEKSNEKVDENLEKKVFGKEYLEKKKSLLQLIAETKEEFNALSKDVFEANDIINQIKDLVLEDLSLHNDYLEFINNEKVKYVRSLNDVCRYVLTSKTNMFSIAETLKKNKNN